MTIKAVVNDGNTKVKNPYPKLMLSAQGLLVLFKAAGEGVVLSNAGPASWRTGEFCSNFAMGCFADFDGSITLTNE